MKKIFFKFLLLIFGLLCINNYCVAIRASGYIIIAHSDTLFGEIKLYKFSPNTGGLIINGIDMEWCHLEVRFKDYNNYDNNRFQTFKPEEILGYGFNYKSVDYIFHTFILESRSIFKDERENYRFLNLIYRGEISLYKDLRFVSFSDQSQFYTYYDYFLFDDIIGLKKVELTKEIESISDLLLIYGFEKDFLGGIPTKAKFKDIKMILMKYDSWLYGHE